MRTWVVLILGAVLGLAPAWAEKRAFIVGVSDYAELVDLKKTIGDAEGYATLFENELNFRVTPLHNPTRLQFSEAFGRFLDTVNPGDEVAFIFSGHGWSDGVENYLVFSDAPRQSSEYALKDQTKALTSGVLSAIRARGAHITFAIIDACRDYPFDSYGKTIYGRGLIRTPLSEGTLVVYAAGDSQVALDRLGPSDTSPYSVFTRVLLPKLRDKNRPLREILRETRGEVRALAQTINHTQRPAFYEDFDGDYCLGGYCSRTPQPSAASLRREQDRSAWQMASEINTLEAYTSYQKQHPYGEFAGDAAAMIDQLTPKEVCENVWQQTYVGQRMEKVHARKTVWGDG
ncbi:MAG: caspase family protein, partial [Pseudomonadota bacterium]